MNTIVAGHTGQNSKAIDQGFGPLQRKCPNPGAFMCVSNLLYPEMIEEAREVVGRLGFSE
jgi:hypothetical protein